MERGLCHCDLVKYCVQERRGKGNARLPWPRLQIISTGKSYINAPVMVFRPLRPLCRAAHLAKAIWGGWRVASDPFGAAARPPAVILLGFGLQRGQVTPTLNKRAKGGGVVSFGDEERLLIVDYCAMAAGVAGGVQMSCGDGRAGLVDGVLLAVGGKKTPLWESLHACVEALCGTF